MSPVAAAAAACAPINDDWMWLVGWCTLFVCVATVFIVGIVKGAIR